MSEQLYGYIYKTTFPDGRYYIGQSKGDAVRRSYFGSGLHVMGYIKKNGSSELSLEILRWVSGDQTELNEAECFFLGDKYKSDELCLNLRPGGNRGGATDEFREKMRAINLGKKKSLEARMKMSKARTGSGNSFFGRKHTAETLAKMRRPHKTYNRKVVV